MKYTVFADGTANLPKHLLNDIRLLSCTYTIDDNVVNYAGNIDEFDGSNFYDDLNNGKKVKTSLINIHSFIEGFESVLKGGQDIIYVSMSSGISGTYNAASLAKEELESKYPERKIFIVDSLGCGFGAGLLALLAVRYGKKGMDAEESFEKLKLDVPHICQYFTVDDLNFLKQTGRVSGPTAAIAAIMNIKPILFGDETGHIISSGKVKGRKAAIEALFNKFKEKAIDVNNNLVCISHGNCLEDANKLAEKLKQLHDQLEITICMHEPFSGSHVGPGMLGLFFYGKER